MVGVTQAMRSRVVRCALVVMAVVLLVGCPLQPYRSEAELQNEYVAAVADAKTAEPGEVSRMLVAITDDNRNLVWDQSTGDRRVLVVTWTSWTGYDELEGKYATVTRDTWVTVAPEVEVFSKWSRPVCHDIVLRVEQLLGLPPKSGKTRFVELFVRPADLFRPSPDPEISDHEALLDFPSVEGYLQVSDAYVTWFNTLRAGSYGEGGYPWTRLGYTYDWGNRRSEVGLSEFVIRKGALVGVHRVATNEAYIEARAN